MQALALGLDGRQVSADVVVGMLNFILFMHNILCVLSQLAHGFSLSKKDNNDWVFFSVLLGMRVCVRTRVCFFCSG